MALAIDASTPIIATQSNGTIATVTSASFTPPAGSLLLVRWSGNSQNTTPPSAPSITDNLGVHLSWALLDWQSRADSPTKDGQAATWWAVVGTSAAMTVTITNGAASGFRAAALKVLVITGQNIASPIGAHGKAGSASAATIAQNYTAQGTNGQGFIVVCDWDVMGSQTAGTGCTIVDGGSTDIGTSITYGFFRRTSADDVNGAGNTLNVTLPATSTNLSWTYAEVLEEPGSSPAIGSTYRINMTPLQLFELILAHNSRYASYAQAAAPDQNVAAQGIPNDEKFGLPSIAITVNAQGIPSSEQLGQSTISTTVTVPAQGIPSSEAVGNANVATITTVAVHGITSSEQLGQPSITTTVTVNAQGITTSERLGQPTITSTVNVPVHGILSSEQLGNPSVTVITAVNAQGITSSERVGNPAVTSTVTVNAQGIPSSETVGNPAVITATSVVAQGIPGSERVGQPSIATTVTVNAQGITSSELVGNANAGTVTSVQATSISTGEGVGQPSIAVIVAVNSQGIPSSERVGNPQVTATYTVTAQGIPSSERLGQPSIAAAAIVAAQGITSSERFGNAVITTGSVTVTPQGITSSQAVGSPIVSLGLLALQVQAHGIVSSQKLGQPFIGYQVEIDVVWYTEPTVQAIVTTDAIYYYEPKTIEYQDPETLVVIIDDEI